MHLSSEFLSTVATISSRKSVPFPTSFSCIIKCNLYHNSFGFSGTKSVFHPDAGKSLSLQKFCVTFLSLVL